jgi:hypothetical protein
MQFAIRWLAFCLCLWASASRASPPEHVLPDEALATWFKSLTEPGTHKPCCSVSDCRFMEYEIRNGQYEITIDNWRYVVPESAIIQMIQNSTGKAVACYSYSSFGPPHEPGKAPTHPQDTIQILCFVPPKPLS